MAFSYQIYRDQLLITPLFMVVMSLAFLVAVFYNYISGKDVERWNKKTLRFVYGAEIICIIVFGGAGAQKLINGGWHLLRESETNAIVSEGYIDSIQETTKRMAGYKDQLPVGVTVNGDSYDKGAYGADIVISGQLYFAATAGDFQVGDHVVISYLPKSHIIMSIVAAPEE